MPGHQPFMRLTAALLLVALFAQACTKAIVVPVDGTEAPKDKALHRDTLTDGRKFETRTLVIEAQSVSFTSSKKPYTFPKNQVERIERIEDDTGQTVGVMLVVTAVIVALMFAAKGASDSLFE